MSNNEANHSKKSNLHMARAALKEAPLPTPKPKVVGVIDFRHKVVWVERPGRKHRATAPAPVPMQSYWADMARELFRKW